MGRRLTKKEWRARKRIKLLIIISVLLIVIITVLCILGAIFHTNFWKKEKSIYTVSKGTVLKGNYPGDLNLNVQLLTPNEFSRPQTELEKIKGVVVHYTANPGTDALQNRNYFENLKNSGITKVSSHFVIGLNGDIVQCIPTSEIAYASNERNEDTISIEVCHPDETGKFNQESYNSLVRLVAYLVCEYNLEYEAILRHYDVTGKNCPKYFVEHEEKWDNFRRDVFIYIENNKA
ncbi:N-acetylmuramoyl-L-alanine amidase [Mobilisporobacter senegalensis]|uniref:N-acetylmuramoyl-L-alanine amidase n=1 Tax=Mobilisporobacter senegalensis TaxID=1329262 RepID=A0A3N1XJI7_9FIRM|nr:peptidoglycan recognition family protein [Mobilisporobacter senegalensis]ROR26311.1 N-acetylmuramoyl-L-alanine amidase [Mobilisporobacter senegalensis]